MTDVSTWQCLLKMSIPKSIDWTVAKFPTRYEFNSPSLLLSEDKNF